MNTSQSILYSPGRNDECFTPRYVAEAVLPYLDRSKVYWLPFDTEESQFVKVLEENGFKFTSSHIRDGKDYFLYEPQHWDAMLSNPPFTGKRAVFERALGFGKPFALLMSNTWLNDSAPKVLFRDRGLQLLLFRNRIQYNNLGKITFSSSFFCCDFLPQQIIILDK